MKMNQEIGKYLMDNGYHQLCRLEQIHSLPIFSENFLDRLDAIEEQLEPISKAMNVESSWDSQVWIREDSKWIFMWLSHATVDGCSTVVSMREGRGDWSAAPVYFDDLEESFKRLNIEKGKGPQK